MEITNPFHEVYKSAVSCLLRFQFVSFLDEIAG